MTMPDTTLTSAEMIRERADWLVDAVATATQNRALLRGDEAEDKVLTEALYLNAIKAMETLIARAGLEAGKAEGWLPIETAPEDGTVILAYRQDAGVFTAHFVEEDAHLSNALNPPEGDCFWFTTSGEDLTGDMPTHWRPLPAPPAIRALPLTGDDK